MQKSKYKIKFTKKVQPGDVIIGGKNFGLGSSREHAPLALKYSGVSAVIAGGFARIFYRNSTNIGLPALECPNVSKKIKTGDTVEVDIINGKILINNAIDFAHHNGGGTISIVTRWYNEAAIRFYKNLNFYIDSEYVHKGHKIVKMILEI